MREHAEDLYATGDQVAGVSIKLASRLEMC